MLDEVWKPGSVSENVDHDGESQQHSPTVKSWYQC